MYFESKLSIAELKPEVLRGVLLLVSPALYVVRTVTSANLQWRRDTSGDLILSKL